MVIDRALEHGTESLLVENVKRIRNVRGDFLLDGAALLVPQRRGVIDAAHAQRLDVQGDVEILGRDREKILRHGELRVRIEIAAHGGGDFRELVGGKAGVAAEHHVLFGMGHAWEAGGGFVGANLVIHNRGDDGRELVAHNDHLKAVGERGAQDVGGFRGRRGRLTCSRARTERRRQHEKDSR